MKTFVDNAPTPPRFLVRFTDQQGEIVFLPLGLLNAKGPGGYLQKPLHVLLQLPREDYSESGCLKRWSVAVSDKLDDSQVRVPRDLRADGSWLGDSFEELRNYLTAGSPVDREGFIVVAHHDNGRLYYQDSDFKLHVNELTRRFGEATVGVLAMCEAGGVNPVDRLLYEKLNRFGLDAAIVSPFSLEADYGKTFAVEFSRVAKRALAQNRSATILELFEEAKKSTAEAMRNRDDSVGEMGLELILVGNPEIRLCTN